MDDEKYKKKLEKFRDKENHDYSPRLGLYAYEIKKLDKLTTLEYVKNWFGVYFSSWSTHGKPRFLKDKQTLLLLRNRPKSEHKDIFDLINKLDKNRRNKKAKAKAKANDPSLTKFDEALPLYSWLILLGMFLIPILIVIGIYNTDWSSDSGGFCNYVNGEKQCYTDKEIQQMIP